jgi:hypothetical protein
MKKHAATLVVAAALAASQPACYGSYGATKALNRWNGTLGSPVVNSVVHFGLWVIPVYPLAIVGDWLIFNNVEFITGNPVFK